MGLEKRVVQDIVVRELFEYDACLAEPWWPEPRTLLSLEDITKQSRLVGGNKEKCLGVGRWHSG